jgi:hypothetical protein
VRPDRVDNKQDKGEMMAKTRDILIIEDKLDWDIITGCGVVSAVIAIPLFVPILVLCTSLGNWLYLVYSSIAVAAFIGMCLSGGADFFRKEVRKEARIIIKGDKNGK